MSTNSKLRNVIILGIDKARAKNTLHKLRDLLSGQANVLFEDFDNEKDLSNVEADLAIVLGGDGSILRSAKQMGTNQIPAIGVNLGRLGFLADLTVDELSNVFDKILAGEHRIVAHLMFTCQIWQDGKMVKEQHGLNETAVLNGAPFSMLSVDLYVDSELVTSYSCDGLIISTPVGSTAHNLSAGGPILRKDLHAFVISPISAHTLTMRPVIDSADRVYEIVIQEPKGSIAAVIDGQTFHQFQANDRIRIQRAPYTFKMIEVQGHGYYRTLREKLGWGGHLKRMDQKQ